MSSPLLALLAPCWTGGLGVPQDQLKNLLNYFTSPNAGKEDGAAGKVAEKTFLQYHNECSASGANIDKSTYLAGYQEGLSAFCTVESGMAQARNGDDNQKLCSAQFGPAFERAAE